MKNIRRKANIHFMFYYPDSHSVSVVRKGGYSQDVKVRDMNLGDIYEYYKMLKKWGGIFVRFPYSKRIKRKTLWTPLGVDSYQCITLIRHDAKYAEGAYKGVIPWDITICLRVPPNTNKGLDLCLDMHDGSYFPNGEAIKEYRSYINLKAREYYKSVKNIKYLK